MDDDLRTLRSREADLSARVDSLRPINVVGQTSFLGVTVSGGSYPTSASRVYLMTPQQTSTNDTEGATPSFSSAGYSSVPAINLGPNVPGVGTGPHLVRLGPDGRWYFRA